jgi:hypothetical protein
MGTIYDIMGKTALFVGTECYRWDVNAIVRAARNAAAMGCDALVIKRWDGQLRWYGHTDRLLLERQAVESVAPGFKYIPFGYLYGAKLGSGQIAGEASLLLEVLRAVGVACADMEREWDGDRANAVQLATALKEHPGTLIVSTWADPVQQNWTSVIDALINVVDAWGPQQYTNWLAAQEQEFTMLRGKDLIPAFDLTSEFGANDPVKLVQGAIARGHSAVWLWEYQQALRNPNFPRMLAALLGKGYTNNQPTRLPHNPQQSRPPRRSSVMVEPGDSLFSIAERLNRQQRLALNWFHDLYLPNRVNLDKVARMHDKPDSAGGSLIFPGTSLVYQQ